MAPKNQPNSKSASTWTWFPTWQELTTHYFKEVGFLACLAQMIGATIFVSRIVLKNEFLFLPMPQYLLNFIFLRTSCSKCMGHYEAIAPPPPKAIANLSIFGHRLRRLWLSVASCSPSWGHMGIVKPIKLRLEGKLYRYPMFSGIANLFSANAEPSLAIRFWSRTFHVNCYLKLMTVHIKKARVK
jgi:hypothetical protein